MNNTRFIVIDNHLICDKILRDKEAKDNLMEFAKWPRKNRKKKIAKF